MNSAIQNCEDGLLNQYENEMELAEYRNDELQGVNMEDLHQNIGNVFTMQYELNVC